MKLKNLNPPLLRANCTQGSPPPPCISLVKVLLALMEAAETELGPSQWEIYFPQVGATGSVRGTAVPLFMLGPSSFEQLFQEVLI